MTNLLAFLAMSATWGLTWLPVKVATAHVPPIFLGAMRFSLAGLVFLAWALAAGHRLGTARPGRLAAAVLLLTPGAHVPMFWGVAHAPTGLAAVVNLALMPVFTMLVGVLAREETVDARRLAAIGLGIAGLALLFGPRLGAGDGDGAVTLGLLAVVLGTLSYASGAVVGRPLLREMPAVALSAWTLAGGLAMVPLSFALEGYEPARFATILSWPSWPALAFLVGFGSLLAFSIYLHLVQVWGLFRAALYAFVSPVVAVLVGIVVLGETAGPLEVAGMAVMLASTAVALWPRAPASALAQPEA